MADKLLDHPETSYGLKRSLEVAVYVNPILLVFHIFLDVLGLRTPVLMLMSFCSLAIAALVSVSGRYFRRNLGRYMGGGFVGRVGECY